MNQSTGTPTNITPEQTLQATSHLDDGLTETVYRGLADRGFDFSDDDVAHIVGLIIAARSDD